MSPRFLTALPVFNEVGHVSTVLDAVRQYSDEVLVVDDGSTDGTAEILAQRTDVMVATHSVNLGYGAALRTSFEFALRKKYDVLVTIDCDGQHEPKRIPRLVAACQGVELVSGSRYLKQYAGDSEPPAQRRFINQHITALLNHRLGLHLTDAFCGFKAYRVAALADLTLTEQGYAMPLELWVQAVAHRWKIIELPIPLIYLNEQRSFGVVLDDPARRMAHYQDVIERAILAAGLRDPIQRPGWVEQLGCL